MDLLYVSVKHIAVFSPSLAISFASRYIEYEKQGVLIACYLP